MKLSAPTLRKMKTTARIPMLTAYTTPVARCLEEAGVPVILVGGTVGMVEMGFHSTREVTREHMEYHVGAVRGGAPHTHVIGDLPYLRVIAIRTRRCAAPRGSWSQVRTA